MMRALGTALRTRRLGYLRRLTSRAETSPAPGRVPEALLARWLQKHDDRLFAALGGAMSFQILRTAYDVGLFALLHRTPGLRRDEIAAALGLSPHATEILLLGLVPLGLVARIGDRYHNHPVLSGLLSGTLHDGALGKLIDYFQHVINPAVLHLEASVCEDWPVGLQRLFGEDAGSFYEAIGRSEEHRAIFQAAMAADTQLNRDRVAASAIFGGPRRLLDVGGNTGELALAIAARHPAIHITVLDFPAIAARAAARFGAAGLSDRLDAVGGDMLSDPFPTGYDAILFAHVLDIFSPEKIRYLLGKAHDALPPGGSVMVFGSVMHDDESGPLTYGVLSAYFLCLAGGEGRFYTAKQTESALRDAGFAGIEKRCLPRSEVVLRGFKPRVAADHRPKIRAPRTDTVCPPPEKQDPEGTPRPGLSKLAAFVRLGRPKFLVYSLLLYALGSAAVVYEARALDFGRWIQGLAFVWCAHLMTHYCNEYFDLAADAQNPAPTRWTGGSRVLVEGHLRPAVSLGAAFVLLFAAIGMAVAMPDGETRWLAFLMIALAWFYTAPPLRLNYRGLGEVTVATVLNLSIPILSYHLQHAGGCVSAVLLGAVLPIFVAQAARMLVMNLSDYEGDELAGKRTLAVALGPRRAIRAIALGQIVAYGTLVALTASRVLPAAVAAAMLLTLPISAWQTRRVWRGALRDPDRANSVVFWASTHVALLAAGATFGLLATAIASAPASVPVQLCASLLLCTVILAGVSALLARQIRRDGLSARRARAAAR
ncbi:MAG: methyltransferase [Minicystis sp.]